MYFRTNLQKCKNILNKTFCGKGLKSFSFYTLMFLGLFFNGFNIMSWGFSSDKIILFALYLLLL